MSASATLLKRLDKLTGVMSQVRICAVPGPYGSDFAAEIAEKIAAGARKTDLFVCVHRFADDWTPESTTPAA
jgi:hypothetical protein